MKLYRGIKNSDHAHWTEEKRASFKDGWKKVLERRATGEFDYPHELNKTIISLHKLEKYQI